MKRVALSLIVLAVFVAARPAPRPGWLGVGYTFHRAAEKGKPSWLHVQRLAPGGPAELAGLRAGDVVTAIDGRPLAFRNDADALCLLSSHSSSHHLAVPRHSARKLAPDTGHSGADAG
jgi:S1-C subfamily serine protease